MKLHIAARIIGCIAILLTIFGVVMVANVSAVTAARNFSDQWYFFRLHGVWAIIGITILFIASKFPLKTIEHKAVPLLIVTLILLILVLIPGIGIQIYGARRWLGIGSFSFQPSELAKLALSIYLAKLCKTKPQIIHIAIILGLFGLLVMSQPDLGTLLVISAITLTTFIGAGGEMKKILSLLPLAAGALIVLIILSPYRLNRLKTFFNASHDPLGVSYQVNQSLIGIGSGGVFGLGIGQSRQKFDYLPEVTTDSIFAIIGEEFGFLGTTTVVILFAIMGFLGLWIAANVQDKFKQNLAIALSSWLTIQAFINISAIVALIPFTGIPLTFISYGRTALIVNLVAIGLIINCAYTKSK